MMLCYLADGEKNVSELIENCEIEVIKDKKKINKHKRMNVKKFLKALSIYDKDNEDIDDEIIDDN